MLLFLASCSDQQVMEGSASSQKLAEQKRMTVSPQDSVMSLLNQARRGDGSAYLKLADCYCDGFGVKNSLVFVTISFKRRSPSTKLLTSCILSRLTSKGSNGFLSLSAKPRMYAPSMP